MLLKSVERLQGNFEMMTMYILGAILASLVFTALISADERVEAE